VQWANIKALIAATTEKSGLLAAEVEILRSDGAKSAKIAKGGKSSFGPVSAGN
jgi:hypothetical protein